MKQPLAANIVRPFAQENEHLRKCQHHKEVMGIVRVADAEKYRCLVISMRSSSSSSLGAISRSCGMSKICMLIKHHPSKRFPPFKYLIKLGTFTFVGIFRNKWNMVRHHISFDYLYFLVLNTDF